MRFCRFQIILVALLPLTLPAAKKPYVPDVLVVADVLTKEKDSILPTKEKPVYYFLLGGKEVNLGAIYAGIPPPDPVKIRAAIVEALASRGFIQTQVGGPIPQIVIIYTWGEANLDTQELSETDPDTGEASTSTFVWNSREIFQLVGLYKAENHLMGSSEVEIFNDAVNSDRGYIFIAALDTKAYLAKKNKLLWRTRISIDTHRTFLMENIQMMLASAAPYFGRDVERPVFVDEDMRNTAGVELGELKFLGVVPENEVPKKK